MVPFGTEHHIWASVFFDDFGGYPTRTPHLCIHSAQVRKLIFGGRSAGLLPCCSGAAGVHSILDCTLCTCYPSAEVVHDSYSCSGSTRGSHPAKNLSGQLTPRRIKTSLISTGRIKSLF